MHNVVQQSLLAIILFTLLLLQGCDTMIKPEQPSQVSQADATLQERISALLAADDYAGAAQLLESHAQYSEPTRRDVLLLQAAEIWTRAESWQNVEAILAKLPSILPDELNLRRRMLTAELEISRHNLDLALKLMQPPIGADAPLPIRQRYHQNMAEIYRLSGNLLESARALVTLDSLLQDPAEQFANQEKLVQTLSTMTDTALSLLQPSPPGVLGGWMELVRIIKRQNEDPAGFASQIEAWRAAHPEHPVLPELLTSYLEQKHIDQSSHIAVLLPRSGVYAKVAAAVRDGFMAAWYQRPVESRPALRYYDSSNPQRIIEVYQKAVQQGAQLVVGPLNKEAVSQLQHLGNLEIPVLALNQVDQGGFITQNLYQFALAPEDEAEQIAERAWLDGHTAALALTSNDDWGRRIYQSFRERWESLGGKILEHQVYSPNGNDFSLPIRHLLNLDASDARKQDLKKIIGVSVKTEPQRRTDAQFIFLAARAQKGRQIGPQLKFYHADGLPVYATSHIYDSGANREQDKDLGQIRFVDTPWLLEEDSQSSLSRERLQRLIPDVRGSYARLYAMGIDAFNLLPHLALLHQQVGPILHGKTGNLYLDGDNRIHRQLAWAEIDDGRARITGYAPRLDQPLMGNPNRPLQGNLPVKVRAPLAPTAIPLPATSR